MYKKPTKNPLLVQHTNHHHHVIFSHRINVPLVNTKPALNLTAKLWVVLVCLEPDQIKFQLVFSGCGFKSKVIPLWSFNAATLQTNINGKKETTPIKSHHFIGQTHWKWKP